MALADDISAALVSAGAGQATSSGTDWFIYTGGYLYDNQPGQTDIADRAISITETAGDAPEEEWALDRPGFQIRVRGKPDDYQATRTKLNDIFTALHAQEAAVGTAYVFVYCKESGPVSLGYDEKRRPQLANNYRVTKARS